MAEFIMKDLVEKAGFSAASRTDGVEADFIIDSAATSREEIGNDVHRGTRRKLAQMNIPCGEHRARQVTKQNYAYYDLLIIMDDENRRGIKRILGEDPENKIHLMLEYAGKNRDVADPWYTGNFDVTYDDILLGCKALLKTLIKQRL